MPTTLADVEDTRYWLENLTSEQRVAAVNDCLKALWKLKANVSQDFEELLGLATGGSSAPTN